MSAPSASADVPVWIFHIKPQLREETHDELQRVVSERTDLLEENRTYEL